MTQNTASGRNAPSPRDPRITSVTGTGVPVRGNDIDTDRIIPARYLKAVRFDGLGEFAFQDVRVDHEGKQMDHPFNDPRYANASILLVNKNFGCGSSREHAPQALMRWGIKATIGESYGEIFAGNCNTMGIPAVTVDEASMEELMQRVESDPDRRITLDLAGGVVKAGDREFAITMPEGFRRSLINGTWDSTALLLANETAVRRTAQELPYIGNFAG